MKLQLSIILVLFSLSISSQNLVKNVTFENLSNLKLCGGANLITKTAATNHLMIRSGNGALRIDSDKKCGSDPIFDPISSVEIPFTFSNTLAPYTIEINYSRVGNPLYRLIIFLKSKDEFNFTYMESIRVHNLSGWHTYKYILPEDEVKNYLGKEVVLILQTTPLNTDNTSNTPLESLLGNPESAYYIDDVSITQGKIINTPIQAPSTLNAYQNSQICYLDYENQAFMVSNPNGTGESQWAKFGLNNPEGPILSQDGKYLYYFEESLTGPASSTEVNPAFISLLFRVEKNGLNRKEIMRSSGIDGREPLFPTPFDPRKPALDTKLAQLRFSPDNKYFSLTKSTRQRYKTGETSDGQSFIEIYDAVTLQLFKTIDPGYSCVWYGDNSLVYINNSNYDIKPTGVYQISNIENGIETLIVPGTGGQFGFSLYQDIGLSVSNDGKLISTLRFIDGKMLNKENQSYPSTALMLFHKDDAYKPKQATILDHGSTGNGLHQLSPDGKFIIYHLQESNDIFNVWWYEIATGKHGKITKNNSCISPYWLINNSNVVSNTKVELAKKDGLILFSNIISKGNMVTGKLDFEASAPHQFYITNSIGQIVKSTEINLVDNYFSIEISALTKGQYFITYVNKENKITKPFIILE